MTLKIDVTFEGKLTCALKNNMKSLANFHQLKNSDFISESKMAEVTFYTQSTEWLFLRYKKISSQVVFFNVQYLYFQDITAASEKLIKIFCETIS